MMMIIVIIMIVIMIILLLIIIPLGQNFSTWHPPLFTFFIWEPSLSDFFIWHPPLYTRSPLQDSRLFGPSPWKVLALIV